MVVLKRYLRPDWAESLAMDMVISAAPRVDDELQAIQDGGLLSEWCGPIQQALL